MTALKRFSIGERFTEFPGNSWNDIADFVERPSSPHPIEDSEENAFGIIAVQNDSSVLIPKGGVMQPTGAMLTIPAEADAVVNQGPLVKVDEPDLSTGAEATYMIATNPIGAGLTGGGIRNGYIWARVDVINIAHKYAKVIDSDATKLVSTAGLSRARIVDQESGTGEKWALIELRGSTVSAIVLPYLHDTFSIASGLTSLVPSSLVMGTKTEGLDVHAMADLGSDHWDLEVGNHYLIEASILLEQNTGWTAYNPPTTYIESADLLMQFETNVLTLTPRIAVATNTITNFSSQSQNTRLYASIFIAADVADPWVYPWVQGSNGFGITGQTVDGSGWIMISHIDSLGHETQSGAGMGLDALTIGEVDIMTIVDVNGLPIL